MTRRVLHTANLVYEEVPQIPTQQAYDLIHRMLPMFLDHFLAKNMKYSKVDNHLGPRGVFPDINRKVGILERVIWDGDPLPRGSEPIDEVMLDLIGHLFLMLYMFHDPDPTGEPGFLTDAESVVTYKQVDAVANSPMDMLPPIGLQANAIVRDGLAQDGPLAHVEVAESGLRTGSGWDALPEDVRTALCHIADATPFNQILAGLNQAERDTLREYVAENNRA